MNPDARITVHQAAHLARVSIGTVRNWRYKGWIDPTGTRRYLDVNTDGYLFIDVMTAERDTRLSLQRSHRRLGPPQEFEDERPVRYDTSRREQAA